VARAHRSKGSQEQQDDQGDDQDGDTRRPVPGSVEKPSAPRANAALELEQRLRVVRYPRVSTDHAEAVRAGDPGDSQSPERPRCDSLSFNFFQDRPPPREEEWLETPQKGEAQP